MIGTVKKVLRAERAKLSIRSLTDLLGTVRTSKKCSASFMRRSTFSPLRTAKHFGCHVRPAFDTHATLQSGKWLTQTKEAQNKFEVLIVFSRIETPEPCTFVRISPSTSHRSVRSWHKEICFAHQCDPQNKLHIAARLRSMDRSEE
jgi:hypothetical protein